MSDFVLLKAHPSAFQAGKQLSEEYHHLFLFAKDRNLATKIDLIAVWQCEINVSLIRRLGISISH